MDRKSKRVKEKKYVVGRYPNINKEKKYAGFHLLADFWFGKIIEEEKEIREILITAARKASNTPLKVSIYRFHPQGITGIVLLAESHIAIHTWPEISYTGIDIFTCGERGMPHKALEYLKNKFEPKKIEVREIKRGQTNKTLKL